ncbi:MAG TPA: hypothetical protein ENJ20_02070, partial [Bacteroidetes bacterium]|nr:hypothetical protein [Bacteroidota bacterium]
MRKRGKKIVRRCAGAVLGEIAWQWEIAPQNRSWVHWRGFYFTKIILGKIAGQWEIAPQNRSWVHWRGFYFTKIILGKIAGQ